MSTPPGAIPPPGPPPPHGPPASAVPSPPPGPPAAESNSRARRPPVVTLAALLMLPAIVTWLIAGIAFFLAMLRTEGDGLGRILVVGIGAGVLALALLVVFLASIGILMAWTGDNAQGLAVPASFTFGLFVVVIVVLLAQGKLTYQPTMVTPLVVGGLAGVSLALIKSSPARAWFAGRGR
ncbi:hypothetical protein GCM10011608_52060 [Micromonospora sonchi]|uniref:Uncharacterized protein n=2 Tax=Micromonospora sonchi TaxID=1763543 RepID=A0A917U769_9ACTN|nr:hypothetical protein GCM10011608_52060 [Micromonospora sonchi]